MDNKIIAIIVVAIVAVAGVGAFFLLNNNNGNSSNAYAVDVNGVEATEDNVANGTYVIQRSLILATDGPATGNAAAFLSWITSSEGQAIVAEEFVALPTAQQTQIIEPNGDVTLNISGSTTIQPIMNELVTAYAAKYSDRQVNITVGGGGSGAGASNALNGTSDIGMLSRDLKPSEIADGLVPTTIGKDGVAVIVNGAGAENLTLEQIAGIYDGTYTNWNQVGGEDRAIAVMCREDGSGTRECFETVVGAAGGDSWSMKSDVSSYASTNAILNAVKSTTGSIGYVSIGALGGL